MELQHAFEQGVATTRFERAPLWQAYPRSAQLMTHSLSADPVFDWGNLADIIANGDRSLIEVREDTPAGRFKVRRDLPNDLRPLVAELAGARRWIMLRELDRWPQFAPLVSDILAAIEPVVQLRTGPVLRPTAFLFVSSPGLVTPLHFDPEFNILFQIAGSKRFTLLPEEAGLPSQADNERYHRCGDNLLEWSPQMADQAMHYDLVPGAALYVPFKVPHTVRVGDVPSISLSVTWRSRDSLMQDDAWAMNGMLARCGMRAPPPGERAWLRAGALRVLRRARIA